MNPAFAGSREVLSTSLFFKRSMVGFDGGKEYQTFTAHTPLKNYKVGLGFLFMHETFGIDHKYDFYLNYAYRVNMPIGKISLGLKGGMTLNAKNYDELDFSPRYPTDPVFDNLGRETSLLPNFGVGFYYYTRKFFLGASIPLLLSENVDETDGGLSVTHNMDNYNYIGNTGVRLETEAGITFVPSILMLYVKNSPLHYVGNLSVEFFDDFLSVGAGYSGENLIASIQVQANEQLKIGYTYDNSIITDFSIQTHEIMLRYEFRYVIKASNPVDF